MEAFINEMVEPRVLDLVMLILPKWRLLVYIFLMNIVIFTPVYLFGVLLINDVELTLICPPVVLYGCNLVHRAAFRWPAQRHNARTLLLGVGILCLGISASGAVALCAPSYWLTVLLYGFVGGFGYQLAYSRMWKVLGKIFNARSELFVVKFLHSCGQATSLLVLLAVFQLPWDDYVYGALLLLLTGVLLHLVPLTLLIEGEKNHLKLDLDSLVRITEKGNESYYAHVTRPASTGVPSVSVSPGPSAPGPGEPDELRPLRYGVEPVVVLMTNGEPAGAAPSSPGMTWKNPAHFAAAEEAAAAAAAAAAATATPLTRRPAASALRPVPGGFEYVYNDDEDEDDDEDDEDDDDDDGGLCRRDDGKCFNQDGVEILAMIPEEDEAHLAAYEAATGRGSTPPRTSAGSVRSRSDGGSSSATLDGATPGTKWHALGGLVAGAVRAYRALDPGHTVNRRLVASVRCALRDFRCYSCTLLKATDVCIFVLFLAILPRFQAFHYHQRARARQMALLSVVVIASAWAACSFLLLWCDIRFRKQQERLLIFGILFQAFGYFCVYSIKSGFWTITGCVLIGVGHAIACAYQDLVVKRKFTARQWATAKAGLSLLSGLTILAVAALANALYVYGRIDNVLLVLLLVYCASGAFWIACNYRIFFS